MDRYEVIVIGGGAWGIAIAFNLALLGKKRVLVLERDKVGSGATGRASGILRQHYDDASLAMLARDSLRLFRDPGSYAGAKSEFSNTGYLVASADAEKLAAKVKSLRALGINTRLVEPSEARQIEPELSTDGIEAFAYEEEAGVANPASALASVADAARKLGVTIIENMPVQAIDVVDGHVEGVRAGGSRFLAPVLVNSSGAWSGRIAKMAGVRIPVKPVVRYMLILGCPAEMTVPRCVTSDETSKIYVMPAGAKSTNVLVGGGSESLEIAGVKEADPDDFPQKVPEEISLERAEMAARRFPKLWNAGLIGSYTGVIDYTPDKLPILSSVDTLRGFYLACGSSSHGFKLFPLVGKTMAELIVYGSSASANLERFDVSRFTV